MHSPSNFKKNIFLLLILMSPFLMVGQQKIGYNLKVNDSFKILQKAEQLITQELEGSKHEITNDLEAVFTFTVMGKTADAFDIKLVFKDFGMKSTSNLQGTLVNVKASEPVEGDMMSQMFKGLIDYELNLTLLANGKIESVDGGGAMIDNMIQSAGVEDDFTKNLMRKSLEKEFSSGGLAKSFEQMTFFYPDVAVEKGSTWENTFSGKLKAENTWQLDEVNSDAITITGKGTITVDTNESGTTMALAGNHDYTIVTNTENGFITTIETTSFASGHSKMTQLGDVEIPTSIKSTVTYELIQ
ncbi:MAG: DUF6263 family protein [Bacteroidota bacterium]